ncbi:hypothetical protein [Desulfosarcina ovata]|uniref:Glucose/Sorbosone dehydrogenase domain-containing protein n=1 Tax=Desulfosarcina ovata subsp. ovata TaxID=2752305 RepID=A0A5K8AJ07_9BACT|nr:hypothetical protein [Desulfosarcina ovata]BBO92673.1 hypothetical protein DSCOOX_58530 [Desulfosarcina ovata subsp. ovata]
MRFNFSRTLFILLMVLAVCKTAWATAEWQVLQNIRLDAKPVDVIVAADNRWIYLLNDRGRLLIYGTNGQLRDRIDVGPDIDRIKAGPREDLVFLISQTRSTVQLISVSVIESIDTSSAPFKGPADAPITVAVFSDFQ